MSTTAALVEGHYFMSRSRMGEKWARCECGVEFEWNDRDKAHALHLLDAVKADALREAASLTDDSDARIRTWLYRRADQIEKGDDRG